MTQTFDPYAAPAPAERLLLCSLRGWAAARLAGQPPHRAVAAALAARAGPRVAALFLAGAQATEAASLRPIEADCPHCGGASADLQRLVVACGLAPVAFQLGEQLLEGLVSEPETVMALARSLNAALAASGWPLPARLGAPPEGPAAGQRLH